MPIRHIVWLILIAALSACGTSAPTHYYLLDAAMAGNGGNGPGSERIGIGPVHIPAYLDHRGIVTRTGDSEVNIGELHLWAEPLDSAVPRLLAEAVHNHQPELQPVAAPWPQALAPRLRFRIDIHRFDAGPDGAVLNADWSLQRTDNNEVIADGSFAQSEPISGTAVSDRVGAESRLLDAFAAKLAAVAAKHVGKTGAPAH